MTNLQYRETNIDVLRGITIMLVILGHITHIPILKTYIWGFHIPLFIFISGYLSKIDDKSNWIDFIKRYIKLMYPYVFFYICTYLYWILIERNIRDAESNPGYQLIGLFYGTFNPKYNYFNCALWYFPCIITIETIFFIIIKQSKNIFFLLLFTFLLFSIGYIYTKHLSFFPFGINSAMIGLIFFVFGYLFKVYSLGNFFKKNRWMKLVFLLLGQLLLFKYSGVDLAVSEIKNIYAFIPVALIGIILYFLIATIINKNKILEFLGINSLILFVFQEQVYRLNIYGFSKIFSLNIEEIRNNLIYCIIITLFSIVSIIPFIYLWNKIINPIFLIRINNLLLYFNKRKNKVSIN